MTKHTFKIKYIAKDGTFCSYTFKSDRKMCVSARGRSGNGRDFGFPWLEDATKAKQHIMQDEDSTMHAHGGVKRWVSALDMTTGFLVSVGV